MSVINEINEIYSKLAEEKRKKNPMARGHNGNQSPPAVEGSIVQAVNKIAKIKNKDDLLNNLKNKLASIEAQGSKIEKALNEQLQLEMYSANVYEQMAVWFDVEKRLMGFASFFVNRAVEEREHAAKILAFMKDCGLKAKISQIDAPESDFESIVQVFEKAKHHEEIVTNKIHELRKIAIDENNHATEVLMDWFVTEQVEELDLFDEWLSKVKMAGDNPAALLLLDHQISVKM